jgi:hypothetical protein
MVVMWCNGCGALLGLREPIADWTTERTGFCVNCAERNTTFKGRIEETNNADEATAKTADDIKASETSDDLPS